MPEPTVDYDKLVDALLSKKSAGSTPTATYGHGPGGAFSSFGLSKPVFGALILPYSGLGGMLPAVPSMDTNPLWGIMTGVTAPTGSNATGACDDCKKAGLMKLCTHQLPFGRYCLDTQLYQMDRIGERRNRGEFTDLTLLNQAFGKNGGMSPVLGAGDTMNSEEGKALFEFGVSWMRLYAPQIWTGSPANNTAGGGYRELTGLDIQINTGHVDAETGVACTAADSIIQSMANLDIASNGATYVSWMTNIYRRLKYIGSRSGLDPVRWVIAMRQSAFWMLTDIWPCAYMTYRCSPSTGSTNMIDSAAAVAMRDDMRGNSANMTGQYLLIDGEKVQVVIDDGITETMNAGESFNSSIYFIPVSVLGGTPVTEWEYFNFDGPNAAMEVTKIAPEGHYYTSDNGRFLWVRENNKWCVTASAVSKPRIVLSTPYLAARMTNVRYTPLAHERDYGTSASYYKDGGGTSRDFFGPSYYLPVP
jgi:hypothetical protein